MGNDERKNEEKVLEMSCPQRGIVRIRCTPEKTELEWSGVHPVPPNHRGSYHKAPVTNFLVLNRLCFRGTKKLHTTHLGKFIGKTLSALLEKRKKMKQMRFK